MTTLIQKVFLPKRKLQILNTIEQNADKIKYTSNVSGGYERCTLTLSLPTFRLISRLETRATAKKNYKMFSLEQFSESGKILSMQTQEQNAFTNKVFDTMLVAYVNGMNQKAK